MKVDVEFGGDLSSPLPRKRDHVVCIVDTVSDDFTLARISSQSDAGSASHVENPIAVPDIFEGKTYLEITQIEIASGSRLIPCLGDLFVTPSGPADPRPPLRISTHSDGSK